MRVLIIGTGNMGRAIATRALAGGHTVLLYNEDPGKAQALATELAGSVARETNIAVAETPGDAVPGSEVVVLATYYPVSLEIARRLGDVLAGKTVVDISNPLNATFDGLVTAPGTSAAETIQAALPGARVVKAFNTTFASTLVAGKVAGQPLDVFIAGDDAGAREAVATLVRSGGLNPVDVGALERARQLEGLGFLGITLQVRLGTHFDTAWRIVMPAQG
jgi:8-hydroxy-5-deazaflavin:NADPH oxidoreductase